MSGFNNIWHKTQGMINGMAVHRPVCQQIPTNQFLSIYIQFTEKIPSAATTVSRSFRD